MQIVVIYIYYKRFNNWGITLYLLINNQNIFIFVLQEKLPHRENKSNVILKLIFHSSCKSEDKKFFPQITQKKPFNP